MKAIHALCQPSLFSSLPFCILHVAHVSHHACPLLPIYGTAHLIEAWPCIYLVQLSCGSAVPPEAWAIPSVINMSARFVHHHIVQPPRWCDVGGNIRSCQQIAQYHNRIAITDPNKLILS